MIIKIVIDNNPSETYPDLLSEHGLSIYFEKDGRKYLLDTGASGKWAENARNMGIDAEDIGHLILSHGHIDHTGGLPAFFRLNGQADISASDKIKRHKYLSYRHENVKDLSPDSVLLSNNASRMKFLEKDFSLAPGIELIYNKSSEYPVPAGNRYLHIIDKGRELPYKGDDEIAVSCSTDKGLVILSSCSHCGILNIIKSCTSASGIDKVTAFIGGLHLLDSESGDGDDNEETARTVNSLYPEMELYTGHCTGEKAFGIFRKHLGEKLHRIHSGMEITV
ncbi:MAG: MBL fold metallo-hydrolase [Bacteroidales bacterium]|jgi:7,8-dihydropterin-6-yl-methyl-4-(beta-D-ribofuranosyl)aminobenzene 5'-phosphate synthase|nr:MBL fold metallo-hydrolase [Bacteroidales bacterium]MCI1784832.1 MBL fold metallo-hydrolase [Bacteroidales bacterium]